jgi:hypothetical protein
VIKRIAWEDVDAILAHGEDMEKIAQLAINWRRALHAGRYDEASQVLSRLTVVTDEYITSKHL